MTRLVGTPPPPGSIIPLALFDRLQRLPGTDTGNAEAFQILYGNGFTHDHSRKRWMIWNGLHWTPDVDGAAERAAIDTARWLLTASWRQWRPDMDPEEQDRIREQASEKLEGESVHGINATLEVAKNLKAELPGILAWAVEGCLDWQRDGLGMPTVVRNATLEYREESDQVRRFISDRCVLAKGSTVSGKTLYERYVQFCEQQGETAVAKNLFAAQIAKRGIEKKRTNRGLMYLGIGLKSQESRVGREPGDESENA